METAPVPPPKRGGTFFYCEQRFRTAAAYRRHYRIAERRLGRYRRADA